MAHDLHLPHQEVGVTGIWTCPICFERYEFHGSAEPVCVQELEMEARDGCDCDRLNLPDFAECIYSHPCKAAA